MKLDYFLKIIDELNKLYSSKAPDEEIVCSANVNGVIYNGIYDNDSFDGKEMLILNKNYKYDKISKITNKKKSFINISKIDSFTYNVNKNIKF